MRTTPACVLFLSLLATSLHATTYVVPDDRYLISAAKGIVTGTVLQAHVRRGASGRIETVTEIAVDESIKGAETGTIAVVHPGGQLGGERLTAPGVPSFSPGERVLLFLERNRRGDWTTWAYALGAFRLADGVLTRGGEDIFGWTVDGARHVERSRLEPEFLEYVRAVVRGENASAEYFVTRSAASTLRMEPNATFTAGSYSWPSENLPLRRNGAVAEWRLSGQVGDLDLAKALDTAVAAWRSTSSLLHDSHGASPASGDTDGDDAEWRIIANDPHGEIPQTCCVGIVAGALLLDNGSHVFQGETFRTLTHADIILNDGMSSATYSQDRLNDTITHELGHTLGLRHADRQPGDAQPCGPGFNCCLHTNDGGNCASVMNSLELPSVTGLQTWDRDAIACLYEGICTTTCTAPAFLEEPKSSVLYNGTSTWVSARVRATPPLAVQWYAGAPGDTSTPLESGRWQMNVRPATTTKYWVRVSDACGRLDSEAATITVVRCPDVRITSASATIVAPGRVWLRANAGGGNRYRWFRSQGPGLPGSLIGLARDITISYTPGATFWVRVENTCGKSAASELLIPSETAPPVRRRRSRH